MRMKKRLAAKEADVTDAATMQNLERRVKASSLHPTQVFMRDFAIRKIAKVASCIAGIGNGDIAQGGATVPKEPQDIPNFGPGRGHT